MPVKVFCTNPSCDASYGVDESVLGRNVRCKKCGQRFVAGDESLAPASRGKDPFPPDASIDIPNPFGKYRVIRRLGRGGMGAVYLAYDDDLDRHVALKIPTASGDHEAEILERFKREAKVGASFHHPNFCPIYEAGKVGDHPYLAMAYIEGKDLSSSVNRERPMNPGEAATLVGKIARAMADAHDKGIVHRDLKPSNVMIDAKGEPVIMDFGLARRDGSKDAELTASNAMLGTIHYMSPEQVRVEKTSMGPPTDIYSLGVILYELITGRRPFEGPPTSVIAFILLNEPQSASDHRPGLDVALVSTCHKAMSKAIADRHASMREFATALDGCFKTAPAPRRRPPIDTSEPIRPAARREPAPPWGGRKLVLAAMGGILAVALGVVIYITTDTGTLKIEGGDPAMEVSIDGREVRIEKVGEPITVRSGAHGLIITRGEVRVKAPKSFEVKRGRETVVSLEFTPKEVAKAPPADSPPANPKDDPKPEPPKEVEKPARPTANPASSTAFAGTAPGESKTVKVGEIDVVLCWCPPGQFTMGSPLDEKERVENEGPVDVTITKGFWVMRTEMTQELYQALTGNNPSYNKGPKLPVESVNFEEARDCAAKLTRKLRESHLLPDGWGIRLPTEAQWEYAARAGTKTATPFGDTLTSSQANFDGNDPYGGAAKGPHLRTTREVGSYEPNAWGLFDTVGNVWEVTLDAYEAKLPGGADPFVAGGDVSVRAMRGGCWSNSGGRHCRSAFRANCAMTIRGPDLGFRLAAVPVE